MHAAAPCGTGRYRGPCLQWPCLLQQAFRGQSNVCLCAPQRLTALVGRVGRAVAADWQRVLWWQARLSEGSARAAASAQRAREEQAQLRRCGKRLLWCHFSPVSGKGSVWIWYYGQGRKGSAD